MWKLEFYRILVVCKTANVVLFGLDLGIKNKYQTYLDRIRHKSSPRSIVCFTTYCTTVFHVNCSLTSNLRFSLSFCGSVKRVVANSTHIKNLCVIKLINVYNFMPPPVTDRCG